MTTGNLARDHWRSSGRERRALVRLRPVQDRADGADLASRTAVREAVERLPDGLRVPVLLYYFADLPVAEIATVTGRAQGTIKRALYDARAVMAQFLGEPA